MTARRSSRAARPSASSRPRCDRAIEQRGDPVAPLGRGFRGLLDADDAIAGVERRDGDARAHQPGADDADRSHRPRRDALQAGDLGRGALGEEDVAQRLGLVGIAQPQEGRAFVRQSFGQRQRWPALRTSRTASTGACWPRALDSAFAAACSTASASAGGNGKLAGAAQAACRQARVRQRSPRRPGRRHDTVDDAERQRFGGSHDAAAGDQLDRRAQVRPGGAGAACRRRPARCRASPRAGRAWLPCAAIRRWQPSAISQAAAERGAIDRRDDRLVARLDQLDHLGQSRLGHRLRRIRGCRRRRRNSGRRR